jgi:hypothetical protein
MRYQVHILATTLLKAEVASVAVLPQRFQTLLQGNHTQTLTYKQFLFTDFTQASKILVFKILSLIVNFFLKH